MTNGIKNFKKGVVSNGIHTVLSIGLSCIQRTIFVAVLCCFACVNQLCSKRKSERQKNNCNFQNL